MNHNDEKMDVASPNRMTKYDGVKVKDLSPAGGSDKWAKMFEEEHIDPKDKIRYRERVNKCKHV